MPLSVGLASSEERISAYGFYIRILIASASLGHQPWKVSQQMEKQTDLDTHQGIERTLQALPFSESTEPYYAL